MCAINLRSHLVIIVLLLAALLTACRRADTERATPLPTITPTPISTPLPPIPTAVPSGSEDNPLTLHLLRPALRGISASTAASRLAETLTERSGRAVDVVPVDTDAEALAALCDSVGGVVNVAFVGGLTAAAAQAQGCGTAVLWGVRGTGRRTTTADTISLIVSADASYQSVADLSDDPTLCRVGFNDVATWLVPSLMLQAEGIDPLALTDMRTVDDMRDSMTAVVEGDCDAAGLLSSVYAAAAADLRAGVNVLAESVPIPHVVLVYPTDMLLDERNALESALLDIISDNDVRAPLRDLLGVNAFEQVDDDVFETLSAFLDSAGVDLAWMGG